MDISELKLDPEEASKLWRKYQTHKHYQNPSPLDKDIERIYAAIAKGKVVINALSSIVKAGLGTDRLPKLAIARADERECWLESWSDGRARMSTERWVRGTTSKTRYFDFPAGSFTGIDSRRDRSAMVPHIPPDIRPRRGLQNYHILFEAVWNPSAPIDPYLIRNYGGDVWIVCGAWDLTPVERAVMEMHTGPKRL